MVLHTGTQSTRLVHNIHQKPCLQSRARWGPCPLPPQPFRPPQICSRTIFLHFLHACPALGAHWQYQPRTTAPSKPSAPWGGQEPPTTAQLPPVPQGPPSSCPVAEPQEAELGSVVFFAKMFLKYSSFGWFGFGGMEWDPPGVTEETLRETAAL